MGVFKLLYHFDCAIISMLKNSRRGVAQFGSALEWGSRGRKFDSCHSDQISTVILIELPCLFFAYL